MDKIPEQSYYLGDGVYVHFDGESYWLMTERHENGLNYIALDNAVIDNLKSYLDTFKR